MILRTLTDNVHNYSVHHMCWHIAGAIALGSRFSESVWPTHIYDLNCTGSERSVWDCPHNALSPSQCYYRNDASIACRDHMEG